ncbi:MAG TPA: hypothetical protein IAA07_13745 [Candidatus Lachnoclostridium stercoravium]|uniref:DRTGG domain-containing protein n=1 Tax=Candidatus Lachnoclostridium stercoravium TaxID=2838633 RepID=A0A9D2HJ92_9FIRM|nr:hypothetical protein [Candidatus Lachnoclostridium stercoravium]
MTVEDIQKVLGAEVLMGKEHLCGKAGSVYSSDMMSDVLAFAEDHSVLVTGLCNPQVIRTAEMLDMACIIFVRGKKPDEQMCRMAGEKDMVILSTAFSMFKTCGLLYEAGLR